MLYYNSMLRSCYRVYRRCNRSHARFAACAAPAVARGIRHETLLQRRIIDRPCRLTRRRLEEKSYHAIISVPAPLIRKNELCRD